MFYAPLGNIRICEYTPSPLIMSHSKECSGDLEKFSALDLGGDIRICEYTLHLNDVTFGNSLM